MLDFWSNFWGSVQRNPPHSATEASQGSDIAEDPWGDTPATLSGSCIQAELPAHGAGMYLLQK